MHAKLIPKTQHGPFIEPEDASPTPLRSYEKRDGRGHPVKTTVVTDFNEFGCFRGVGGRIWTWVCTFLSHGLTIFAQDCSQT